MKRILFLDDQPERHQVFETEVALHSTEILFLQSYTAQEAIDNIKKFEFDIVFLDHDLADCHYDVANGISSDYKKEMTGKEVADFMAEYFTKAPVPLVVVHSWNHHGVQRILSSLNSNPLFKDCVFASQFNSTNVRQVFNFFCVN